jgi:hypothetical protein
LRLRSARPWPLFVVIWTRRPASSLGTPALFLALALVGVAMPRGAAASELALEWSAPAECPDRAELASRVSRLVGGLTKTNLTAVTEVTRSAGVYRARLRVTSSAGLGERVLENASCEILAGSIALVIALSAAPSPDVSQLDDARDEGLALAISANASALFGPLSQPALGVGGGIAVEGFSSLRFELRGAYFAPQSTTFDRSSLGGRFGLITFGVRGCRLWSFGAFDLAPCAGADLDHVTASGFGGTVSRQREADWWGPALGVFSRLHLAKALAIDFAADGVVPLFRRRFVFSDVGELQRASAIALEVRVAPEVRF